MVPSEFGGTFLPIRAGIGTAVQGGQILRTENEPFQAHLYLSEIRDQTNDELISCGCTPPLTAYDVSRTRQGWNVADLNSQKMERTVKISLFPQELADNSKPDSAVWRSWRTHAAASGSVHTSQGQITGYNAMIASEIRQKRKRESRMARPHHLRGGRSLRVIHIPVNAPAFG
jgi:hypothetical protein